MFCALFAVQCNLLSAQIIFFMVIFFRQCHKITNRQTCKDKFTPIESFLHLHSCSVVVLRGANVRFESDS